MGMNLIAMDVQFVNAKKHQINQTVLAKMDNLHSKVIIVVGD
jgi:hypothetical protein